MSSASRAALTISPRSQGGSALLTTWRFKLPKAGRAKIGCLVRHR